MRPLLLVVTLAALPAWAHFRLLNPPDRLATNADGDPTGGQQKTSPCGAGTTQTNMVTDVTPGEPLNVRWIETVGHPGHYRISIASNQSAFPAAVATGTQCQTTTIMNPVVAPVLMDGVHPHASGMMGTTFNQTVTVPNLPAGPAVLQIFQYMSSHAQPCFYYHCANLRILAPDAGMGTAGGSGTAGGAATAGGSGATAGGGTTATAGGTGGTAGGSGNAGGGATATAGGGSAATAGGTGGTAGSGGVDDGGCTASGGGLGGLVVVLALGGLLRRRRATKSNDPTAVSAAL
ncbi:MAG: hypothetical protein JNK82_20980 [Myxococcaceae bacterium]|nr:hypothetical protein [Myxococcaceae bacterium]